MTGLREVVPRAPNPPAKLQICQCIIPSWCRWSVWRMKQYIKLVELAIDNNPSPGCIMNTHIPFFGSAFPTILKTIPTSISGVSGWDYRQYLEHLNSFQRSKGWIERAFRHESEPALVARSGLASGHVALVCLRNGQASMAVTAGRSSSNHRLLIFNCFKQAVSSSINHHHTLMMPNHCLNLLSIDHHKASIHWFNSSFTQSLI